MYANMMLSIMRRVCTFGGYWQQLRRSGGTWLQSGRVFFEFPFRREFLNNEATFADIWPLQFGHPAARSVFPVAVIG